MFKILESINPINPDDAKTQNKDRLLRAEALGFDTSVKWYHGGFEHFDHFKDSEVGIHFAKDKRFAEDYASSKSMDMAADYDIVVRAFYVPKKIFDFRNKNHIEQLSHILPEHLHIEGRYGWGAFFGGSDYDKEGLLDAIQGIGIPYTGLSDDIKDAIRSGAKSFRYQGSDVIVDNYNKTTDTVEYVESWEMQAINNLKYNVDYYEKNAPNDYRLEDYKKQLKDKMAKLNKWKIVLTPKKQDGYDNWQILESPELRPYLLKLGYKGAIAQEKKHINCVVFSSKDIRSIDAEFSLDHRKSSNINA